MFNYSSNMETLPCDVLVQIFDSHSVMTYMILSKNTYQFAKEILVGCIPIICNNKITDESLKNLKNVKFIDLRMCRQISDHGLVNLSNAIIINLRGCHKITDMGISYLKSVQKINISGCFKITYNGLSNLKNLNYVDVSWTNIKKKIINIRQFIKVDNLINNNTDNIPIMLLNRYNKINFGNPVFIDLNINFINKKPSSIIASDKEISKKVPDGYHVKFNNITTEAGLVRNYCGEENDKNISYMLYKRQKLFKKIYNDEFEINDNVDSLLKNYVDLLPHHLLLSNSNAINRLHKINPSIELFCRKIREAKLNVLIGGSAGLYCVWTDATFKPNDLDVYILDLIPSHFQLLEDIIYQTFDIVSLIVVRSPLTMTFYVQIENGTIYNIQLNLLKIKSWSQLFVTYHTDLTCIGYEILTDRFIYMKGRWENILTKKVHYFSNILNFDSGHSLYDASWKYMNRNFNCHAISIDDNNTNLRPKNLQIQSFIEKLVHKFYDIVCSPSADNIKDDRLDISYLPNVIYYKYKDYHDRAIASTVAHLYDPSIIPISIVYLSVYMLHLRINRHNNITYLPPNINIELAKHYFNYSSMIRPKLVKKKHNYIAMMIKCDYCGNFCKFFDDDCNKCRRLVHGFKSKSEMFIL